MALTVILTCTDGLFVVMFERDFPHPDLGSWSFLFLFIAEYSEFCFANCLLWGGDASTLWPKFSWLSITQASELLVPSPFGRSFLRLPPWFQEALRDHGFGPHQSDGHVLMLSCLRVATEDDALVIDDQPTLEVVGDRLILGRIASHTS